MSLFQSIAQLFHTKSKGRGRASRPARPPRRLRVEGMEERAVPALIGSNFEIRNDNTMLFEPVTASAPNGASVVVYSRLSADFNQDIVAQRFGTNGLKLGGEISVISGPTQDIDPSVAMDDAGNFIVTWTQLTGSQSNILVRRFTGGVGGLIMPVADSIKPERDSDVAMHPTNGTFVVSYTEDFSGTDVDVKAARFNASGEKQGTNFVSTLSNADESQSSVAMDSSGNYAVAYTFDPDGAVKPNAVVNRYDADGVSQFSRTVNDFANGRNPSVGMDALGNMVVAYERTSNDGTIAVFSRRVGSTGVLGADRPISLSQLSQAFNPEVAVNPQTGAYVVAFAHDPSTSTPRLKVREVAADDSMKVAQDVTAGFNNSVRPSVSVDHQGKYFVTFGTGGDILGRHGRLGTLS